MFKTTLLMGALFFVASTTLAQTLPGFSLPSDNGSKPYYGAVLTDRPYSGDYSAGMIRSIWNACWQGNQMVNPQMPPQIAGLFCDCVTDLIRNGQSAAEHQFAGREYLQNKIQTTYAPVCMDLTMQRVLAPQLQ
jgi:hypothetical protein